MTTIIHVKPKPRAPLKTVRIWNSDDEDDIPAINDVESLKKGVIKTSKNNQASYTILLVGETGVGKTSFIEFIANVLLGKDVDHYDLQILDHGNEQGGSSNQSRTNSPRTYEFTSKNGILVRILDTPGLGGTLHDELHKESIATHIHEHIATVNAVLILANGTVPRLTVGTDYALSAFLPKTLANNVAFLFTNVPIPVSFNFCEDAIPEILEDAPRFHFDNPFVLQRNYLELKNNPIQKKARTKLRKIMLYTEDTGLELLVDLFDWLDGCGPQPTTEVVALSETSQAIETKFTNTLTQMDQVAAMIVEVNKLAEAVQTNSVQEAQATINDSMEKQREAAKEKKAKTAALVATSVGALDDLNRVMNNALDGLAGLTAEYARLSLSGSVLSRLGRAIWLLECRFRRMEEKGVSQEQLAKMRKGLGQMKLALPGPGVRKARSQARPRAWPRALSQAWSQAWPWAKAAVMEGDVGALLLLQLRVSTRWQAIKSEAEAEACAVACVWARSRGQGESVPSLADLPTIRDILSDLNRYGAAHDLWDRSPGTRDEYSCIIQFISPITRLPLELLHQIFLIIINEGSGPPSVLMLVCKRWHAVVTAIWAPLNLGTRTPMDVVAEKLRRNQWFLDIVVDTESDRGDFTPSDSAFEGIFAAMGATSRWRSLVVESFPGQADLPEQLVNRGLQQCSNATMSRFTTLRVKCACEASPLLNGLLRILGTTASSELTTMEIISENVISFLAPAYPSIFRSVKILSLDTLRIRNPVDLLPHLYQLETFTASHISFPIYHNDINLPFIHTLRHLSLRASSIQWMSGRTFHVLEHCTLVFPLHHHVLHTFKTTLPNCVHLTFQGFPLDILNGISAPKLVQLSVTCSGSSSGRGAQQLAQLSRRALGESQLAPKILHISIKATNEAWMNALAFMSNLEELEIRNTQPSSLTAKVFQLLVVQPAHAGNLGAPSTPEEVGAPLCSLLRRLGLKYDRWLRQSEQFDLIPVFASVIRSRQHSNCPLKSFSLWMRNDQRDPLELIERSQMSVDGFKRLVEESGIQDGLLDFTAMGSMQVTPNPYGQSVPPLVPLLASKNLDQQKEYKSTAPSRSVRI